MSRVYYPYSGDLLTYGSQPEHNFFPEGPPPAQPAPTLAAPQGSTLQAPQSNFLSIGGGADNGGPQGGGSRDQQGGGQTGNSLSDTWAAGRSMGPDPLSMGSIVGGIAGMALGMPGIGGIASMGQHALDISSGARHGDKSVVGSGIPSQLTLGDYLDRHGPMTQDQLASFGINSPSATDIGMEQGGYDTQNNSQGWGLADRAANDMAASNNGSGGPAPGGSFGNADRGPGPDAGGYGPGAGAGRDAGGAFGPGFAPGGIVGGRMRMPRNAQSQVRGNYGRIGVPSALVARRTPLQPTVAHDIAKRKFGYAPGGEIGYPPIMQQPQTLDTPPSRPVQGLGDGKSDSVPALIDGQRPAALSTDEHVIPAPAVAALGRGSSQAGHQKLKRFTQAVQRVPRGRKIPRRTIGQLLA